MEQLTLKIPVGCYEASSQKQDNDAPLVRVPRQREKPTQAPQLRLRRYLPVVDDKVVQIGRPLTVAQCEQRNTWLPYCPHASCQYHLLVDFVNDSGATRSEYITEDGEFDLDKIPRIVEEFDAGLLDPADRPPGAMPGTLLRASVPATCALRVARTVSNTEEQELTFETIGKFLGVSKERARQITNIAHAKARVALIGDTDLSPSDLLGET